MPESSSNQPLASAPHPNQSSIYQTRAPEPPSSHSLPTPKSTPSSILIPPHPLASSRYHRQALLPSISIRGQTAISNLKVLIIGLGGLGSPASLYLAALGVHTLGLIDGDTVELSNLHRQIVHSEKSVGMSKVASAAATLKGLNSEIRLSAFEERFSTANAKRIVQDWTAAGIDGGPGGGGWDIVLDCTDNPATRYLISDACVLAGKVLVSGAAQRTEGQLMVLNHPPVPRGSGEQVRQKGPCYRCVFPVPPAPEMVQSCAEVGVLGPVVGVIGVLMAMEVVKIVVSSEAEREAWKPSLLLYSGMSKDPRTVWRSVGLRGRRKDCVACGDEELLREKGKWEDRISWQGLDNGRVDYEDFCGRMEDVKVLGEENRVPAGQFIETIERKDARDMLGRWSAERPLVVDVREEAEFALGAKVKGAINVPISKILRHGSKTTEGVSEDEEIEQLFGPGEATNRDPLYFVCQRGNDSQIAAQQFLAGLGQKRWVGDVTGGFVALEKYAHA